MRKITANSAWTYDSQAIVAFFGIELEDYQLLVNYLEVVRAKLSCYKIMLTVKVLLLPLLSVPSAALLLLSSNFK